MYCSKCGLETDSGDVYCRNCVTAHPSDHVPDHATVPTEQPTELTPEQPTEPTPEKPTEHTSEQPPEPATEQKTEPATEQQTEPTTEQLTPDKPPEPKPTYTIPPAPSLKWLVIALISIATIIATALAAFFIFFYNVAPMITLGKSLVQFSDEIDQRFNNTPLKALAVLSEILEDGTVSVDFNYNNNLISGWLGGGIGGNVKLSTNRETRELALEAKVDVSGDNYDVEAYMNRERIAYAPYCSITTSTDSDTTHSEQIFVNSEMISSSLQNSSALMKKLWICFLTSLTS